MGFARRLPHPGARRQGRDGTPLPATVEEGLQLGETLGTGMGELITALRKWQLSRTTSGSGGDACETLADWCPCGPRRALNSRQRRPALEHDHCSRSEVDA